MSLARWFRGFVRVLICGVGLLAATSCNTFTTQRAATRAVEAKQQEIVELKAHYDGLLTQIRQELEAKTTQILSGKDAQMRAAADAFFAQDALYKTINDPVRRDLIWHNYTIEGWTALGLLMPSYDGMKKIQERLARELDEMRTSLEDLKREHDQVVSQNRALADATAKWEAEKVALAQKLSATEREGAAKLAGKQSELAVAQNAIIAAQNQDAQRDAARQAQLSRLSWGAGILAVGFLLGAIFSPVFKPQMGMAAAALGVVAVSIPFLEPWHIGVTVGVVVVALTGWAILDYRRKAKAAAKEEQLSDHLVLGLQRVKEKAPETWEKEISPVLRDQMGQYTTGPDGKTVVVPDPEMEALVDQKLKDYQVLSAPVVDAPVPTPTTD